MIFPDKLAEAQKLIQPEIYLLFDQALKNQSHPSDLLLVAINGFYDPMIAETNNSRELRLNPHLIGFGKEGLSEHAHYKFIDNYRGLVAKISNEKYLQKVKYDPKRQKEIDQLTDIEEYTIQLEMLIYIKIWEADMFIKRLYELMRLIYGESYDWYFKICESARDEECSGTRQDIIRKQICDPLMKYSKVLYEVIKSAYKTQIRNSIAHSNYSFLGRYIHPNNEIKNDQALQIRAISFDEWGDMFHKALMFYNEYVGLKYHIRDHYKKISFQNGNRIPVRIIERSGTTYETEVSYYAPQQNWTWTTSLNESDILRQVDLDKELSKK